MSRFADQVRDQYGILIPGVSVYVYVWDANAQSAGSLETLTADDSSPLANPVISDAYGEFYFNAPDGAKLLSYHFGGKVILEQQIQVGPIPTGPPGGDGALIGLYSDIATVTVPGDINLIATSGRSAIDDGAAVYAAGTAPTTRSGATSANSRNFVLSKEQIIVPQMFYEATDPDFYDAVNEALIYLKAEATTGYGYGQVGGSKLLIPRGLYLMGGRTLDYDFGLITEGESVGLLGPGSTVLKWAAGTTAFRTQNGNTTGATGTKTPVTNAGIATFRNLLLDGGYAGTESEAHGFHLRETACLENVSIYNFAGDGVYMHNVAGGGAPNEGNSNCSTFTRVFAQNCRNGFNIDLADNNACVFHACNAIANRQWGVWDSSFLGNTYIGFHAQTNGVNVGSLSLVTYSGNRYFVKRGQEVGASTNPPSGTTADNTWWYYFGVGGTAVGITTWTSGVIYRAGGSYCTDDTGNAGNLFDGCYQESDQPPAQFVTPTLVVGGSLTPKNYPVFVGAGPNLRIFNGGLQLDTNITALGTASAIGPQSGVAADSAIQLWNTNVASQLWGRSISGDIGTVTFYYGNGIYHDVANAGWRHRFRMAGIDTFNIDVNGAGYTAGVGGTATQATNKGTGVPLNKVCGEIALNGAALAAGAIVSFTLTNSTIAADDFVDVWLKSGNATAGTYRCWSEGNGSGSRIICLQNISGGSLSEAVVLGFGVNKRAVA